MKEGELVPVKEWSCPIHDQPERHECDCDLCTWEEPECCANAEWVDKKDSDGNVVMREVSDFEVMLASVYAPWFEPSPLVRYLEKVKSKEPKIQWLEDESLPVVKGESRWP